MTVRIDLEFDCNLEKLHDFDLDSLDCYTPGGLSL